MWTLIAMALAALLWLVVVTLGHGVDAEPDGINLTAIQLAAMSLTALSVAQLLQRLLSHLLLGKSATQGAGRSSDLLRSVLNVTLYLVVGVLFLHYGLGQDVTSVLATSALLTAILGLALQPTLGHLFSGVSIEIERPLRVGDYVRRDELEGRVVSLSWRSVSLETDRGTLLVMPNAEFTSRSVEIIRASQPSRHQIVFHMASNCSPSQVLRVAMQVLRSDITDIVPVPAPSVVILGSDPLTGTLRFAARFFTLKFLDRSRIASLFMERLWFALSREGLALPQRPMLGSTEEAAGWHLMPDHGPAQEQLLAAELPLPAAAGRAAAPQPAAMRGLVAQSLAGVPAALRQELLAAGQLALYGPDERCNRRQAGVLVQGQLAQDRPPQPEQRQRELDWLRAQVAPLPSQSPSQLLSAEAMVMEPDHFERFVQRAALAMGPLAHSLCLRIALHTDDLSLAHALLAESIPDPAQRQAFLAQAPAPSSSRLAAPAWFAAGAAFWSAMPAPAAPFRTARSLCGRRPCCGRSWRTVRPPICRPSQPCCSKTRPTVRRCLPSGWWPGRAPRRDAPLRAQTLRTPAVISCVPGTRKVHIVRTNIEIDDKLMKDALLATGAKTKKEAVELGLRTLLDLRAQEKARELRGKITWEGDLNAMRTDK